MLRLLLLCWLPSIGSKVASANTTSSQRLGDEGAAVHTGHRPVQAAAIDSPVNSETSSLAGYEFNTPYSHEIAALAAILVVIATASVALAVKFTRRSNVKLAATEGIVETDQDAIVDDNEEDETAAQSDDCDANDGGRSECVPIMHRFSFSKPSSNYTYESLLQTRQPKAAKGSHSAGLAVAVFRLSARLDEANGLLCLHGIRLKLHATKDSKDRNLTDWGLAIDIVAQTDVECRQARLQTRLAPAASDDHDAGHDGGWVSEPIEDVLAVRVKQEAASQPPRGRLLIRALALQNPLSLLGPAVSETRSKQSEAAAAASMVKLGGATFSLDRIRRPSMANLEVTLRDKT